jgi:hypothetical protein
MEESRVDPTEQTVAGRRVRKSDHRGSVSQLARSHTLIFDLSREYSEM